MYCIMNVHDVLNLSIYTIHQVARKGLRQIMSKLRGGTAELRDETWSIGLKSKHRICGQCGLREKKNVALRAEVWWASKREGSAAEKNGMVGNLFILHWHGDQVETRWEFSSCDGEWERSLFPVSKPWTLSAVTCHVDYGLPWTISWWSVKLVYWASCWR